jgi:hypothetical protein
MKLKGDNTTYVDPPEGWRYGFPMLYDNPEGLEFNEWLVSRGYPQSIIDQFEGDVPCRYWLKGD